ncbi:MAG: hypothetical protein RR758_04335 [Burkholderiaceae bacterium]
MSARRILLSTEPYPFTAIHVAKLQALLPGRPVQLLDGEMTGWYGSRTAAGLAYLRSLRTTPPIEADPDAASAPASAKFKRNALTPRDCS